MRGKNVHPFISGNDASGEKPGGGEACAPCCGLWGTRLWPPPPESYPSERV